MPIGSSIETSTPFASTPAVLNHRNPSAIASSGGGYSFTEIVARMAPKLPAVAAFGGGGGGAAPAPAPVYSVPVGMTRTEAEGEMPWTLIAAGVGALVVGGLVVVKLRKKKR